MSLLKQRNEDLDTMWQILERIFVVELAQSETRG